MNDQQLKHRLTGWANAYGGEQFQRLGYASGEKLTAPAAPATAANPADRAAADGIERIVQAMEQTGRWKEARVLRAECFMPTLPESERLRRLNRIGLSMGRSAYYAYLASARSFVLGALALQLAPPPTEPMEIPA